MPAGSLRHLEMITLGIQDLKRFVRRAWIARSRYPVLRVPLPTRFEGGWFLAFGDEMGYTIFFKRIFEDHERRFFERIIKQRRRCTPSLTWGPIKVSTL